jgi:hypothetical protein
MQAADNDGIEFVRISVIDPQQKEKNKPIKKRCPK